MGAFYEEIPENIQEWILQQKMLFVSTAPLASSGHVNVSPKGGTSFGILDSKTFWYHDLTGSGCETISHLNENGRITVMFCGFVGSPRIVRLWGKGRVIERETAEFNDFVTRHAVQTIPATRSIIMVDIHQVGSSCGFSVPFYDFKEFRKTLNETFERKQKAFDSGKSKEDMPRYWAYKNAWSMDGLPGMARGIETGAREGVKPIEKMIGPYAPAAPYGPQSNKLSNQLRYQLTKLDTTRIQLKNVLLIVLLAFLMGSAVAIYAPVLAASQREKFSRILV